MDTTIAPRKLTLADIADVRAYERERDHFRQEVIELKRRRRVHVGPVVTLLFENRDTIRFQIQEMARVEKLVSDADIQSELDIYNPIIPERGEVCATMFVELTSDSEMREWLPKLAGVERCVLLALPNGDRVRGVLDEQHEQGLTRDYVTAAVHYLRWKLSPDQVVSFETGPVSVVLDHPAYLESTLLRGAAHAELVLDLTR